MGALLQYAVEDSLVVIVLPGAPRVQAVACDTGAGLDACAAVWTRVWRRARSAALADCRRAWHPPSPPPSSCPWATEKGPASRPLPVWGPPPIRPNTCSTTAPSSRAGKKRACSARTARSPPPWKQGSPLRDMTWRRRLWRRRGGWAGGRGRGARRMRARGVERRRWRARLARSAPPRPQHPPIRAKRPSATPTHLHGRDDALPLPPGRQEALDADDLEVVKQLRGGPAGVGAHHLQDLAGQLGARAWSRGWFASREVAVVRARARASVCVRPRPACACPFLRAPVRGERRRRGAFKGLRRPGRHAGAAQAQGSAPSWAPPRSRRRPAAAPARW